MANNASRHCPHCDRWVLTFPQGPSHGLHFALSWFTCGFWAPIWLLMMCFPGQRCSKCGLLL